MAMHKVN